MAEKPISTPLPADLPTNWQTGQTVSPTGTEVGLTQQHGYNYQSQQINNAHTAINTINDAFENIYGSGDVIPITDGGTGAKTPQEALVNLGAASNPNLLDNWYFVGGVSQQGGGQFPINQRGQTSYTGAVYGIDRWKGLYGSELVALENDCLSLTFSGNQGISQILDSDVLQALEGQAITQTILWYLSSGNYANAGLVVNETSMLTPGIQSVGSQWMITSNTVQMPDSIQSASFTISGDGNIKVKAVKLELGDHQTLAYQDEDGNWQLFETPDYAEELAKCQRYFVPIMEIGNTSATTVMATALGGSSAAIFVPLPCNMRIIPSVDFGGGVALSELANGNIQYPITGVTRARMSSNVVKLNIVCSGGGLTAGTQYPLTNPSAESFLYLSAEL